MSGGCDLAPHAFEVGRGCGKVNGKLQHLRRVQGTALVAQEVPGAFCTYKSCCWSRCGPSPGDIPSQDESLPIAAHVFDPDPGLRNQFHAFDCKRPGRYGMQEAGPVWDLR